MQLEEYKQNYAERTEECSLLNNQLKKVPIPSVFTHCQCSSYELTAAVHCHVETRRPLITFHVFLLQTSSLLNEERNVAIKYKVSVRVN